jgi:hypothetical protein
VWATVGIAGTPFPNSWKFSKCLHVMQRPSSCSSVPLGFCHHMP